MHSAIGSALGHLNIVIPILLVVLAIVVVYLILMVRAVISMLRYNVSGVLLTFAFLALIPFPLTVVMGIMILIVWHFHRKDILAGKRDSG
jgi:hypothetical protein